MTKKFALIIFAALLLTLSACTRAASLAPVGTPSPNPNFPSPMATTRINAIELAGTQTAVATAGLPLPTAEGTAITAPAGNPTFTPLAGISNATAIVSTPLPTITGQAPVATAVPAVATSSGSTVANPGTYSLHEGEFPYCLARRYNVNPDQLLSANGISSGQSYYKPGTVITIPQSAGAFPGARAIIAHPAQYTVRAGDTIYSIACVFGDVDPMAIVSANSLSGSYSLTAGTTIQIP